MDYIDIALNLVHNSPPKEGGEDNPIVLYDFGDLPDLLYPTLLANNGPRHKLILIGGPYLGSIVDADADGIPSVDADGDDTGDGTDDHDGVNLLAALGKFDVTVDEPDGYINARIDWDGGGLFDKRAGTGDFSNPLTTEYIVQDV